jgi:hypothetical protein
MLEMFSKTILTFLILFNTITEKPYLKLTSNSISIFMIQLIFLYHRGFESCCSRTCHHENFDVVTIDYGV